VTLEDVLESKEMINYLRSNLRKMRKLNSNGIMSATEADLIKQIVSSKVRNPSIYCRIVDDINDSILLCVITVEVKKDFEIKWGNI